MIWKRSILLVSAALVLSACGDKTTKNYFTTHAAPLAEEPQSQMCIVENDGTYKNEQTGEACAEGQTSVCPPSGFYQIEGELAECTPGMPIARTSVTQFPPPRDYPFEVNPIRADQCAQYKDLYGIAYIPAFFESQMQCFRSDLSEQYSPSENYRKYGDRYFYAYPPVVKADCTGTERQLEWMVCLLN